METDILKELKELKSILSKVIGSSDLPKREQFSIEAINKAAKEFRKLNIARGEWVEENKVGGYLRGARWYAGKFIRNEFAFTNFFKQGHYYYYNKKDLIKLNNELKKRNVNLDRYIELKKDEQDFKKKLSTISKTNGRGKKPPYQLPQDLKDITTSAPPLPLPELVREDLNKLKEEFFQFKLSEYIDIYRDNHAMMKYMYPYQKHIDLQVRKRCMRWCENFNYANNALELITKKRETFVPVQEKEMIEL
jgi:hypothetical protein